MVRMGGYSPKRQSSWTPSVPEGIHDAWVIEAEEGVSASGNPKLTLKLECFDDNGKNLGIVEAIVPLHVEFRAANMAECLSRPHDAEEIPADALIGRACRVHVIWEKWKKRDGSDGLSAKVDKFLPRRFADVGEGDQDAPATGGASGPACPF